MLFECGNFLLLELHFNGKKKKIVLIYIFMSVAMGI